MLGGLDIRFRQARRVLRGTTLRKDARTAAVRRFSRQTEKRKGHMPGTSPAPESGLVDRGRELRIKQEVRLGDFCPKACSGVTKAADSPQGPPLQDFCPVA